MTVPPFVARPRPPGGRRLALAALAALAAGAALPAAAAFVQSGAVSSLAAAAAQYSLGATFFPCGAEHAPCDVEPVQLQVTFPAGQSPQEVQIAWAPASPRPPGAPDPTGTSALLDT
ncbi:MAG TPA: hypothetical protein VKU88_02440, partial [Acidimicrobiales bacterium]|nr:hypothetical protein [Acidimicrobiales bacterium]